MWGSSRRDGERRWSLRAWLSAKTDDGQSSERRAGRGLVGRLRAVITAAAFWLAIPLPVFYLPVLFSGLDTRSESLIFGVLVVGHVAALSLGYSHGSDRNGRSPSQH